MAQILPQAHLSWQAHIQNTPQAFDQNRARSLTEIITSDQPAIKSLMMSAFGNSDYLARIVRTDPDILADVFASSPDDVLSKICRAAFEAGHIDDRNLLMQTLRQQKNAAALLIALADLAGIWPLEKVMAANTRFADACVHAAIDHLARHAKGIKPSAAQGGLIVIAMGKYGAGELNYSSDIDLAIFYDPSVCQNSSEAARIFPKIARDFVHILQARTENGYVFRVDLSLRPDPGSTPAAISLSAAQQYYETVGQNWERAAFIKARAAAGDLDQARRFLDSMQPFIWRKYLDFAVLEDIHAMKRQAHAAIGMDEKEKFLPGRDIKRASGGIRDIEMFVQSQQLIAGGRDPLLRRPQTCAMLGRLAARQWITKQAARDLVQAYRFLRHVEHRLQMTGDEQTHKLPVSDDGFSHIAFFSGFDTAENFREEISQQMDKVRAHYANLFVLSPSLGSDTGALVFTGGEDDPETLQNLRDMGFAQPEAITRIIRGWHAGHIPAMRSQRARELLTALVPVFLKALAQTPDPQASFARFDKFLSALPMAVQFFSLLQSHPAHIEWVALICGSAPRLTNKLAENPRMIEAMLEDPPENLHDDFDQHISRAQNYEDMLDTARLWAHEQQFRTGTQILKNRSGAIKAAAEFSAIAETIVIALLEQVEQEFIRKHGRIKNGAMSILAAGSLGAREMTDLSDLDLIFIYQAGDDALSDGHKPIPARLYYARLAQMFIQALTAPTAAGMLYNVDMRLRPSGRAGPVAIALQGFAEYQRDRAWVWEHMALTRMRPITGEEALQQNIAAIIKNILCQTRSPPQIAEEVLNMRRTLAQAHPAGMWNISYAQGGLIDAEFICQYLQLIHAAAHPDILDTNTQRALSKIAAAGLYETAPLLAAIKFFKSLIQPLHLSIGRVDDAQSIPKSLHTLLAEASKTRDLNEVQTRLIAHLAQVKAVFENLIGIL